MERVELREEKRRILAVTAHACDACKVRTTPDLS